LTSEGKPLKDYLEAKNHSQAIELLHEYIHDKRNLTESLIKELHGLLLKDIEFTYAKGAEGRLIKKPLNPGKYKTRPNHVLTISGKIHHYTDPIHVKDDMEELIKWFKKENSLNIVEKAAIFHHRFVAIHPFDDGNGRLARLLMNLILMKGGYLPCIVKRVNRKKYLECLEVADVDKDVRPFVEFIGHELFMTMETVVSILEGKSAVTVDRKVVTLNIIQRESLILQVLGSENKSIGQISELTPQIKRATLKKDLTRLVKDGKVNSVGKGKGVLYYC